MDDKPWYLSKTMWSAVVMAGIAIYTTFTGQTVPFEIYGVLGAFGLVGMRLAVSRNGVYV